MSALITYSTYMLAVMSSLVSQTVVEQSGWLIHMHHYRVTTMQYAYVCIYVLL